MPLNDNFLNELKMKTDIEDIISTYIQLKKRGRTLVGLCPFHNEKTPSFTVYPETQSYYCFGCGSGGDAVTFIKNIENLDYVDALKSLAQRAGMQMPDDKTYDDSLSKKRIRMLSLNRDAAKFFHDYMMTSEGEIGLNYFLSRQLSQKTINHFGLGYAPDSWDKLIKDMTAKGYTQNELIEAGLAKRSSKGTVYDNFRNRVMTPIIDIRGNVIAFGGRVLDDSKPKYINTSDTLVYKKTNELFAMNFAKDSGTRKVILCEGYMDVIAMHQAGFTNSVAGCGTALTNEQVRLLTRYFDEVILCYDADEAGQKALNKAMILFNQTEVKVKIPKLIGGKDPDEIIRTYGRDKFKGLLEGATNEIEFKFLELSKKYDISLTSGKVEYIKEAIKILYNVTPVEQDLYMSKLSEELSVDKSSIKIQFDDYKRKNVYKKKKREYQKIVNDSLRENTKASYELGVSIKQIKAEERIIGLLLKYPDCYKLCDDFDENMLSAGFIRKAYSLIYQRLKDCEPTDIINLSKDLTDNEIGRLSGIIARCEESKDSKKEFNECKSTISNEFKSKNVQASKMSDDEFRKLFDRNT